MAVELQNHPSCVGLEKGPNGVECGGGKWDEKNASCYAKRGPLGLIITWGKAVCVVSGWSATFLEIAVRFPWVPQRVMGGETPSVVDHMAAPGCVPASRRDVVGHCPFIRVERNVNARGDRVVRAQDRQPGREAVCPG